MANDRRKGDGRVKLMKTVDEVEKLVESAEISVAAKKKAVSEALDSTEVWVLGFCFEILDGLNSNLSSKYHLF